MFKFKLQSVLEYRINLEEKIQGEFSQAKRDLEEHRAALKALIAQREKLINDLRNLKQMAIPADDIASMISSVDYVRNQEKTQEEIIQKAREALEQKRSELMEAVKNRKVIEKLRDKHAEEYRIEQGELEQKNSDEMSVLKFRRREV